jgi:U3 small nucleolar RNA-associated protein 4
MLTLKNIRDSYGGTVWAMAASKRGPMLGLGCEDGTVKLFSFANSQLDYQKSMSATGTRILSVCFHPVETRVYAGCADGTIRCYNEVTSQSSLHYLLRSFSSSLASLVDRLEPLPHRWRCSEGSHVLHLVTPRAQRFDSHQW